jgi:hypothetical protein
MSDLIKKLRFDKHPQILIRNAPPEFKEVLNELKKIAEVDSSVDKKKIYPAILCFVKTEKEVKEAIDAVIKNISVDALLWLVFPKKTSKKYKAEINRDSGWQPMGDNGFEPVSLIAMDEDWSALRFRNAENIKTMTRSAAFAMSDTGKKKTTNRGQSIGKTSK